MSTLIGELLQEASLVSTAQIEVAIRDQSRLPDRRIGEILSLRGWIKPETVDFFVEEWPGIINNPQHHYPIGFYFKASGLLDEFQIEDLLREQKMTGIKFGSLAVLRGWIKQKTLNFFLKYLTPHTSRSPFIHKESPFGIAQKIPYYIPPRVETAAPKPSSYSSPSEDSDDIAWVG